MSSVFNTAATSPPVPLPVSIIAGKLCCDHRHFMRNGYVGDWRHRPSSCTGYSADAICFKACVLAYPLADERPSDIPRRAPASTSRDTGKLCLLDTVSYQSKLAVLQMQTHVHCHHLCLQRHRYYQQRGLIHHQKRQLAPRIGVGIRNGASAVLRQVWSR